MAAKNLWNKVNDIKIDAHRLYKKIDSLISEYNIEDMAYFESSSEKIEADIRELNHLANFKSTVIELIKAITLSKLGE